MQKLRPLGGHDEYCVHRLLEEERQREALAAHAKRDREQKVPWPNWKRALVIVFGIFFFGVLGVLWAVNSAVTFGR